MGSNTFGRAFKITTWGESHGVSMGVVIDGCPAGLKISEERIEKDLARRAPGSNSYVTPRKEPDRAKVLSGILNGVSTGAPIAIEILNSDVDSSTYNEIKKFYRPGHANYTYLSKYGICDEKGGGRASARETVARVVAGSIAAQLLEHAEIKIASHLRQVGPHISCGDFPYEEIKKVDRLQSLFWMDPRSFSIIEDYLNILKQEGDSTGGVVETVTTPLPVGLGDPVYEKLEARLAYAMMGLPASKGFEMGDGFAAACLKGSEHNDLFIMQEGLVKTATNHSGGTLGGISNGMPLIFKVAFKPTSSIKKPMQTLTKNNEIETLKLSDMARHDPCVAIRAVPIVEAMTAIVLADAWLMQRLAKI